MRRFFRFVIVVVSVFGLFSCEKDEMNFGAGFLDDDDVLYAFIDTTSVPLSFMTVLDDTMRTSKITYMAGQTSVAGVGTVKASFLSKFYYNNSSLIFVDTSNYSIESVVLEMDVRKQFFGDTIQSRKINVYQLKKSYTADSVAAYAKNLTIPSSCLSDITALGSITYTPKFDSLTLRLKFLDDKAQEIFNSIKSNYNIDSPLFILDSLLQKHFAGLYITSDDTGIINFAPRITFNAKNSTGKETSTTLFPSTVAYSDTSIYKVVISEKTATKDEVSYTKKKRDLYVQSFTIFEHTFESNVQNNLNKVSQETYVSGFNGLRTRILLPQLNSWKDSVVIYNSVKLYIPVERVKVLSHSTTQTLYLQIRDKNKNIISTLIPVKSTNDVFIYNLTLFMNIFKESSYNSEDYYFELVLPDNNVYGNVFKINTVNPEKFNFVIKYSK